MTFVETHCPACGRYFRESANHLCEGQVLSCPHCGQSWPLSENSPYDETQRLLRVARQMREKLSPRLGGAGPVANRWYA